MLILFILLVLRLTEEEGYPKTSFDVVSRPGLGANPVSYPAGRRFSGTAGKRRRNGMPNY
jgi:hypothetical protein